MQHFEQDENGVWVLKEEVAGRGREAVIKVSSEMYRCLMLKK